MKIIRTAAALILIAVALPAGAKADPATTTPMLIERAVSVGELSRIEADLLLASSFTEPVPARFRGTRAADGTLVLLGLRARLAAMPAGGGRDLLAQRIAGIAPGRGRCSTSAFPSLQTLRTAHFRIEYTGPTIGGGIDIEDYATALERAWATEVDAFGWAAPPSPDGGYLVRVDPFLEPIYYGYVAATANVGDNADTAWVETDAYSSCMVLQANYDSGLFPSTPENSMKATVGHEFNHSIQFGYGALVGEDEPQQVFSEGGASWMEDESFDEADDSTFYLWPDFNEPLGGSSDFPYSQWIIFRGITERFGAGTAGGGEDVMQAFWEQIGRGLSTDLDALRAAVATKGLTLEQAFHDYAIATAFVAPCEGGYALPYCYEEAAAYKAFADVPGVQLGMVDGETIETGARDNFALHWTELNWSGARPVSVTNTSDDGTFRASVVCDTGSTLAVQPFPGTAGAGASIAVASVDPSACARTVLVVTNETQTSSSPTSSSVRSFSIST